jgi:hypothetical protein
MGHKEKRKRLKIKEETLKRMSRKLIKFGYAGLMLLFLMTACARAPISIPHPPRFSDIIKGKSFLNDEFSEEDSEYKYALWQALDYSLADLDKIRGQDNLALWVGGAYQMHNDSSALRFLLPKLSEIQTDPAALALFISYQLQTDVPEAPPVEQLIDHLHVIDPENSLPYYFKAYWEMTRNNPEACLASIVQGNSQRVFHSYTKEFSRMSITASEFLGYSPFTARYVALGLQPDLLIYPKIYKYLFGTLPTIKTFTACAAFGKQLQQDSITLIFDLVAINIQRRALEKIVTSDTAPLLGQLQQAKKAIQERLDRFEAITEQNPISEKRFVQYFDELYAVSEAQAMETLFKEYK